MQDGKAPVVETPSPLDPVYLKDLPLCGLTMPDDDPSWRYIWRAGYQTGGVTALFRDGDWLWVATPVDVVRLNLRTLDCTRFDLSRVRSMLSGPDGHLWAVSGGSLTRFDGQSWKMIIHYSSFNTIAFDTDGNLWAQISRPVADLCGIRYPGHEPPETGTQWEGESVQPSSQDACEQWTAKSGQFGLPRSVFCWHPGASGWPCSLHLWASRWTRDQPIAVESDERLWMLARRRSSEAGQYDMLSSFDGQGWRALPWHYGAVPLVADEIRGGVWAGTDAGLVFSDGRSIQKYLLMPGDAAPIGAQVRDLIADDNGRLQALTDQELLLYDETLDVWQTIQAIEPGLYVSADDRGGLWAVSYRRDGQISYFDGETWTHHQLPDKRQPCVAKSILADGGGGVWLSSYNCALYRFNGEVWDEYDNGSRGDKLFRGPDGTVYAVEQYGHDYIRRYDGDSWETLPLVDLPSLTRFTDLVVGPEGEVWAAVSASPGLLVYRDGEWERAFGEIDEAITALMIDSGGDLWAGHGEGLWRYDGETWKHVESRFSLGVVYAMAQDRQGRIWVGGHNGLGVYDPASTR